VVVKTAGAQAQIRTMALGEPLYFSLHMLAGKKEKKKKKLVSWFHVRMSLIKQQKLLIL